VSVGEDIDMRPDVSWIDDESLQINFPVRKLAVRSGLN
jgi:hypothetical protein